MSTFAYIIQEFQQSPLIEAVRVSQRECQIVNHESINHVSSPNQQLLPGKLECGRTNSYVWLCLCKQYRNNEQVHDSRGEFCESETNVAMKRVGEQMILAMMGKVKDSECVTGWIRGSS